MSVALCLALAVVLVVSAGLGDSTRRASTGPSATTGAYHAPPALSALGSRVGPSNHMVHSSLAQPRATKSPEQVNPLDYYSTEPAPMGIADYGVTSAGGTGYTYFTPAVRGVVTLDSNVEVENSSLGDLSPYFGLQLNAMLVFVAGGVQYVYWTQDVLLYNSSSDDIAEFIDNVWNESASGAEMYNSTISGNGTVNTGAHGDWYADDSLDTQPGGEDVSWSEGGTVTLEMDAFETSGGQPGVAFVYADGGGEYAYDVVDFPWAANPSTFYGFVVTGTETNPLNIPYDLELIFGGPGGGSQTYDAESNTKLQLLAWNGNNFESPLNAFDFGAETAEGSEDVEDVLEYNTVSGNLSAHLLAGSDSYATLRQLYSSADVGVLNFTGGSGTGALVVNGTPTPFEGGGATVTLYPGQYFVNVSEGGTTTYLGHCTLKAGGELNVTPSSPCSGGTTSAPPSSTSNPLSGSIAGIPILLLLVALVVLVAVVVVVAVVARRRSGRPATPPAYGPAGAAPPGYAPYSASSPPPGYAPGPTAPASPAPSAAPAYAPVAAAPAPARPAAGPATPPPGFRPCPRCGTMMPVQAAQCPRCGLYFGPPPAAYSPPPAYAPVPPPRPIAPAPAPAPAPSPAPTVSPAPAAASPTSAARFCPNCGSAAAPDAAFCHKCGFDFSRVRMG